jgi:hypothetical protein
VNSSAALPTLSISPSRSGRKFEKERKISCITVKTNCKTISEIFCLW